MSRTRSPLLPIFLIVVVDVLGLTIILPLLPFYAEKYGASPTVVGLLIGTYALCQLVSGPILGQLSDRMGRKPLLIVSQIGTLLGFLLLSQATALWVIFVSRVIDGATAGNLSLAQAYISDVTEAKDRAKSFALIGIAFGLGFLVGPGLSGWLAQFSYTYPIYVAAGLSLTSIIATATLLPRESQMDVEHSIAESGEAAPGGKRLSILSWGGYLGYLKKPVLRGLLAEFFFFSFSFATFTAGFALFAERRFVWHGQPFGPKEVGYIFAYAGLLGIILQGGLIGRLVARFGERKLITAAFLSAAVAYFGLGLSAGIASLLVVTTLASFGTGVLRPAITSLVTQNVGRHEQGVVLGLTQSLNSVAQIAAPLLAGVLITHMFLATWAWVAAGSMALGLVLSQVSRARAVAPEVEHRTA